MATHFTEPKLTKKKDNGAEINRKFNKSSVHGKITCQDTYFTESKNIYLDQWKIVDILSDRDKQAYGLPFGKLHFFHNRLFLCMDQNIYHLYKLYYYHNLDQVNSHWYRLLGYN